MALNEDQLNIEDEIEQHHDLMTELNAPDKEELTWLHKRILTYYKEQELDLENLVENAIIRFYKPLGVEIIALVERQEYEKLPDILKGYQTITFQLDRLFIIDLVPVGTPLLLYSEWYLDALRWLFGPLHPDKIDRQSIVLPTTEDPNGPKIEFANWSKSDIVFYRTLFKEYSEWLKEHTQNLSPQFQLIADEVREFLKNGYQINPNKDGFIKWFISKKIGTIKFRLTGNFNSSVATLQTDYRDLFKKITPTVVEKDLHAYCKWKLDQQKELLSQINHQDEILLSNPAIIPMDSKQVVRPFPELLVDSYSKNDLDRLLIHLRMRNRAGQNIWPQAKKAGLYGVIDALVLKSHLIETTRKERMSSLSNYLGLKDSRVKDGYAEIQTEIKQKAISFLNQPVK